MALGQALVTLRRSPADGAPPSAYLRPRAIAVLGHCRRDWCEVSADGADGWVRSSEVWGLAPQAQCH
jgi:SH3-like domain-containing protein